MALVEINQISATSALCVAKRETSKYVSHYHAKKCQRLGCNQSVVFKSTDGFCTGCYAENKKATVERKAGRKQKQPIKWV